MSAPMCPPMLWMPRLKEMEGKEVLEECACEQISCCSDCGVNDYSSEICWVVGGLMCSFVCVCVCLVNWFKIMDVVGTGDGSFCDYYL